MTSKGKSLPVRVVSTPTPPRLDPISSTEPIRQRVSSRAQVTAPTQTDRRTLTIVLVGVIMVGVVIAWVAVVGSNLAEPNRPNSLVQGIQKSVDDAFNR